MKKRIYFLLYAIMLFVLVLTGCKKSDQKADSQNKPSMEQTIFDDSVTETTSEKVPETTPEETTANTPTLSDEISEDGEYNTKEKVALYIDTFGHLPGNYLTKKEASGLGYVSADGNLWDVAPGKSIGGDKFGNREGLLPTKKGRQYYECDIDFDGGFRNGKRIVFSNDGLIYYTEDHYASFELLYGEE